MIRKISPIQISNKAKEEIKHSFEKKSIPSGYALRAGIKDSGEDKTCFVLGFDIKTEDDNEYEIDGIKLIIDKSDILQLAGLIIDYKDDGQVKGFIFLPKDTL